MANPTTTSPTTLVPSLGAAWQDVDSSIRAFLSDGSYWSDCTDAVRGREAASWSAPWRRRTAVATDGATKGKLALHGGKVVVRRPRVRSEGHEVPLPPWRAAQAEDWLGRRAMNLMLIPVSTRKLKRAVSTCSRGICQQSWLTARQNRRLHGGW